MDIKFSLSTRSYFSIHQRWSLVELSLGKLLVSQTEIPFESYRMITISPCISLEALTVQAKQSVQALATVSIDWISPPVQIQSCVLRDRSCREICSIWLQPRDRKASFAWLQRGTQLNVVHRSSRPGFMRSKVLAGELLRFSINGADNPLCNGTVIDLNSEIMDRGSVPYFREPRGRSWRFGIWIWIRARGIHVSKGNRETWSGASYGWNPSNVLFPFHALLLQEKERS